MSDKIFSTCPSCHSSNIHFNGIKKYTCPDCGWKFFHNTAAAVGGIIEFDGKVLVVTRNREPQKGALDFPGGFVDPNETAEEALVREVCEELGVVLDDLNYLCTAPNIYRYKGIEYTTCDIFYIARLDDINFTIQKSEIADYNWVEAKDLKPELFGFESMRKAIRAYLLFKNSKK